MHRRLYLALALLLFVVAGVFSVHVLVRETADGLAEKQSRIKAEAWAVEARHARRSHANQSSSADSKQAFDALWMMGMEDLEHQHPSINYDLYGGSLKSVIQREKDLDLIKQWAVALSYQHAQALFSRFHGETKNERENKALKPLAIEIAYHALERMMSLAPDASFAYLSGQGIDGEASIWRDAIALGWSENDPEAATKWWAVDREETPWMDWQIDRQLYQRWAGVDHTNALKMIQSLDKADYQGAMFASVLDGLPEAVDMRQFSQREFVAMMDILRGFTEAQRTNSFLQQEHPMLTVQRAMGLRLVIQDRDAGMEWFRDQDPEAYRDEVSVDALSELRGTFVKDWAEKDSEGFISWAVEQGGEEKALAYYFDFHQPEVVLQHVVGQRGEGERVDFLKQVMATTMVNEHAGLWSFLIDDGEKSYTENYYDRITESVTSSGMSAGEKMEFIKWLDSEKSKLLKTE